VRHCGDQTHHLLASTRGLPQGLCRFDHLQHTNGRAIQMRVSTTPFHVKSSTHVPWVERPPVNASQFHVYLAQSERRTPETHTLPVHGSKTHLIVVIEEK
jgi:hypothetical protein